MGILVSGGLAPGVNAVIAGVIDRYREYRRGFHFSDDAPFYNVYGYVEGFKGLTSRLRPLSRETFTPKLIRESATRGGSILATAREDGLLEGKDAVERTRLLNEAANRLWVDGIGMLFVIGGHGSMRAAYAISQIYDQTYADPNQGRRLQVIGIPKSMDNDILWVWQSFGFESAVERATSLVLRLHTEVRSNPRLCVAQLYGSDSGFVVSHTALGSGVCDLALIPEMKFSMDQIEQYIVKKLDTRKSREGSPYGLVIMSETALPTDAMQFLDVRYNEIIQLSDDEKKAIRKFEASNRRFHGQTPDDLRNGTLKIVSRVLQDRIKFPSAWGGVERNPLLTDREYWNRFRVFVNEPRHLIRSTVPSAMEVAYASRLGTLAMDAAMAGYYDAVVSQWLTEFVIVPMRLSILGKKKLPLNGMFWKSVAASIGQPGFEPG